MAVNTDLFSGLKRDFSRATSGGLENLLRGGAGVLGGLIGAPEAGFSEGGQTATTQGGVNQSVLGETDTGVLQSFPLQQTNAPLSSQGIQGIAPSSVNQTLAPSGGGGTFPADQYIGWDPNAAQADWEAKGSPGGGQGNIGSEISDIYEPALQSLRDIEGSLLSGQTDALGNIESKFTKGGETIGRERGELESALSEQSRKLGESARSAYADATRSFNNLIQQGLSRFGAGSSAGPAVQELVNQEFLRSRGRLGQQEVAGQQQISQEQTKLTNYIQQKRDDLGIWKEDAIAKINENFTNSMNEINSRRADIEGNKTRDRIAALQSAVSQANDIKSADKEYRLGLAQFAVEQMQETAGRAFTPQEIAAVVNDMMGQELGAFSQRTAPAQTAFQTPTGPLSQDDEEFQRLITSGQA